MRIPYRREQTGDATQDRVQRQGQVAAFAVNELNARLDTQIDLVLKETFTTTSDLAQSTKFAVRVKDGDKLVLEYWGLAGCSGSANGMKYAIGAPSRSTIQGILDSSLTTAIDDSHQQILLVNTLTTAVHTVNGGNRDDYINARIKVVGDGVVVLRACSTTSGNITTILRGALMRVRRYVEV